MTQRDPPDGENADPEGGSRRPEVSASSFYGSSSRRPSSQVIKDIRQPKAASPPAVGIDLDAVDSVPTSPEVDTPDLMIEDVQDTEPVQKYQPTTISSSSQGWPDVQSMYTFGHGQLPNALLGRSRNPAFALGAAFKSWTKGAEFAKDLVDYQINLDFIGDAPASASSAPAAATNPPPQKAFSYSQAAASGSKPAQADAVASSAPSKLKLKAADLLLAKPHPHAYFNVETFAWTVIAPFPNHTSNPVDRVRGCPGISGPYPHQSKEPQLAHHYVCKGQAVDPKYVLRPSEMSLDHSTRTLDNSYNLGGPAMQPLPNPADATDSCWHLQHNSPMHRCWDVYLCANCRNAFTVSGKDYVPSVLGADLCKRFSFTRRQKAPEAKDEAVRDAIDYMWKVLRNILFRNQLQAIPQTGATFIKRMGDSKIALEMFHKLGFRTVPHPIEPNGKALEVPPMTEQAVLTMTRAFLELSIWSAHLLKRHPSSSAGQNASNLINLNDSLQDRLAGLIGSEASEEYIPGPNAFTDLGHTDIIAYRVLGITPEADNRTVLFAYHAQIASDPNATPQYLEALKDINTLRGSQPNLEIEIALAASQDKLSMGEVMLALRHIGAEPKTMSVDESTGLKQIEQVTEEQIVEAYGLKREQIVQSQGSESDLKELRDAMRIITKAWRSDLLDATVMSLDNHPAKPTFTEEEAYKHLNTSKETDDATLCTAAQFYLSDATSDNQRDRIRAAVEAIAEARKSTAMKKFLEAGEVPSATPTQEVVPVSIDRPAGLQNIGNTCYLNSLLQYFFTIRELREVVLNFEQFKADSETVPTKRVGGREISRKEIERSIRFTQQLSNLFSQLIYVPESSVRPELDLAYLALVSSKDEDEANSPKEVETAIVPIVTADSPADAKMPLATTAEPEMLQVDAAEEGLVAAQAQNIPEEAGPPPSAVSPSVLGKRNSEHLDEEAMDVDRQSRGRSGSSPIKPVEGDDSWMDMQPASAQDATVIDNKDGEAAGTQAVVPNNEGGMAGSQPPPLPPRPEPARKATTVTNSTMMFGKQNDVSEAMDNVIFQIEAALDERKIAEARNDPFQADTRGFIQGLFYGSSRQSLEFESPVQDRRVKDETFSYLLVDVATEGKDLYDGLDASLQTSTVEVEGKQATRTDVLTQLPPILQIQLQRVQFDRKTAKIFKSNAHMPFPETLRMGRYLSPGTEDSTAVSRYQQSEALRQTIVSAREKLSSLEQLDEDKQSAAEILKETGAALQQIMEVEEGEQDADALTFNKQLRAELAPEDGSFDAVAELHTEADIIEGSMSEARKTIKEAKGSLEALWANDSDNEYELSSVFIHLGAAGYGHYYLYQRALPSQPERWLKFNDSTVTDVPASAVLEKNADQSTNPYWLTYVRKSEIAKRIDAVHRQF